MSFYVTGWKILIKPEESLKEIKLKDSGVSIEIPDSYRARGKFGYAIYGEVEQIAQEVMEEKDTMEMLGIKVGSKVIIDRYVGAPMKRDGIEYRIIQPDDIVAVVEE